MKLAFAGTPEFSVAALDALHAAGHSIVAVYTQPDRPAGRGRQLTPTPVARRAAELGIPTHKPLKFDAAAQASLREHAPELMVVVAYGLILPAAALAIPEHGCFNIHASLLPRWRGAAPIQRAILAGDAQTGITIMRMDAGLDTGPMLLRQDIAIGPQTTAAELHDQLAALGARMIVQAVDLLARGQLPEQPQPAEGVTYAGKISKDEARLDWSHPAAELVRAIHAYNPAPGAWSELNGERLKFFRAAIAEQSGPPGCIISADASGVVVSAGTGAVRITELQRPGGRVQPAREFLAGRSLAGCTLN
ncbi:MAG TPA: methionyl-tRNA formyltransferase [Nevskiaceae bacterium]|nr:methionyl-tRNA formyltransferase [Nevskiaceae bacterium]